MKRVVVGLKGGQFRLEEDGEKNPFIENKRELIEPLQENTLRQEEKLDSLEKNYFFANYQ